MLPETLKSELQQKIDRVDHPREMAIDVINALQEYYGYFSDEAVAQAVMRLLRSPRQLEGLNELVPCSSYTLYRVAQRLIESRQIEQTA